MVNDPQSILRVLDHANDFFEVRHADLFFLGKKGDHFFIGIPEIARQFFAQVFLAVILLGDFCKVAVGSAEILETEKSLLHQLAHNRRHRIDVRSGLRQCFADVFGKGLFQPPDGLHDLFFLGRESFHFSCFLRVKPVGNKATIIFFVVQLFL